MFRTTPATEVDGARETQAAKAEWTTADIPDQTDRVAIIAGANIGVGFETATALASRGAQVVLAVRNLDKGKAAAARIGTTIPGAAVTVQQLDLSSLDSIRSAAADLRANFGHIDLLINNAGVMGTPESATRDGFELQFGTNYLGHFALTGLLLDHVLAAPNSRIVTVSSAAHRLKVRIEFDNLQGERSYNSLGAYALSKLADLLFAYELQRRLADSSTTISVAAHRYPRTDFGTPVPVMSSWPPSPTRRCTWPSAADGEKAGSGRRRHRTWDGLQSRPSERDHRRAWE
ncbi:oxidoreductase [Mycobacterium sp.]|uniref:oxidoreductase n=1 Tax=Mycobacterium sp. TaxID=1785 RepID=UPI003340DCE8